MEFAGLDEGGGEVTLGGKVYPVAGWSVAVSTEGRELVSIGESQAFALEDRRTRYTVELEGLDTQGLERLASFTAKLGGVAGDVCGLPLEKPLPKPGGVRLLPAAGRNRQHNKGQEEWTWTAGNRPRSSPGSWSGTAGAIPRDFRRQP